MAYNEYSNWGERLQDIIEDAVDSMNFDRLSNNVRNSVESVFDELNIDSSTYGHPTRTSEYINPGNTRRSRPIDSNAYGQKAGIRYARKPAGIYMGPFLRLAGFISSVMMGLVTLLFIWVGFMMPHNPGAFILITFCLIALIITLLIYAKGISVCDRLVRFDIYKDTIGGRSYCQIDELAQAVDRTAKLVVNDIQKLIANGSIQHGYLDDQCTCLMLDYETYQQYLEARSAYHERVINDKNTKKAEGPVVKTDDTMDPELAKAIEEGNRYIEEIRKANEAIPGIEISNKLFALESIIKRIFDALRTKPDQLPKLRKFMSYYMPTTLKLVNTYRELDSQTVAGENIVKAKTEIEISLDAINLAYEKILDSFFEDAAMDIRSDISVLNTMFAQEGLTKDIWGK